jgi:MFS family permease
MVRHAPILKKNTDTDCLIAVAFVAVVVTGYFGDKYPKQRGLIISGWLTCSLICAVVICAVYNFKARYALLVVMAAGLWATNACALSYAASTFSDMPRETRGVALALVNALGNLAQIYGYVLQPMCIFPQTAC